MAYASSGQVHRNLSRKSGTSAAQRKNGNVVARALFITLITLAIALSALAIHLSRKVMQSPSYANSQHSTLKRIADAPKVKAVAIAAHANAAPHSTVPATDKSKDRVYCMVPFIWNEEIYNVIMKTWGKRCDVINFLTDAIVGGKLKGDHITDDPSMTYKPYWEYPLGTFPANVKFINMTRSWNNCAQKEGEKKVCRHIWEKMWRSWVYVQENHLDQAEWFCKVDYDTFFFPENVKYFVNHKHWDPLEEYHYFGHKINNRKSGRPPMVAGATACWSHKTLNDVAEVYRNMPMGSQSGERGRCEDRAEATEEASTAQCLHEFLNVTAYAARDDDLREYITLSRYKDQLTWNRTEQGEWWYWKGKPKGAGEMENSIAHRPIGLHRYKQPKEIQELDDQFFGPKGNKEMMKLNQRTKAFVEKVRRAMGTDV